MGLGLDLVLDLGFFLGLYLGLDLDLVRVLGFKCLELLEFIGNLV